jgi:MSHA biogenesis protein MshK
MMTPKLSCVLGCIAMLAGPVFAQVADPTEPPAIVRRAKERPGATADAEPVPVMSAPRLQSVLISSKRRIAVIDGETVKVGQRHRGAVVASIEPTRVVLMRGKNREILRLYPTPPGNAARQR